MLMGTLAGGILPHSVGLPLQCNHGFQFVIPQQKVGLSRFQDAILHNCDEGDIDGQTCKLGEKYFKTSYYVPGYVKFSRLCLSDYKQYNAKISKFFVFTL
jgi:hypothetical protein